MIVNAQFRVKIFACFEGRLGRSAFWKRWTVGADRSYLWMGKLEIRICRLAHRESRGKNSACFYDSYYLAIPSTLELPSTTSANTRI